MGCGASTASGGGTGAGAAAVLRAPEPPAGGLRAGGTATNSRDDAPVVSASTGTGAGSMDETVVAVTTIGKRPVSMGRGTFTKSKGGSQLFKDF